MKRLFLLCEKQKLQVENLINFIVAHLIFMRLSILDSYIILKSFIWKFSYVKFKFRYFCTNKVTP